MKLLRLLLLGVVFFGCSGGEDPPQVDAPAACEGAAFDECTSNAECESGNCHLFMQDGFQVCVTTCANEDDTMCPNDSSGVNATCNRNNLCKPVGPNASPTCP